MVCHIDGRNKTIKWLILKANIYGRTIPEVKNETPVKTLGWNYLKSADRSLWPTVLSAGPWRRLLIKVDSTGCVRDDLIITL